jgi:hypothetical protein
VKIPTPKPSDPPSTGQMNAHSRQSVRARRNHQIAAANGTMPVIASAMAAGPTIARRRLITAAGTTTALVSHIVA